MKTQQIISMDPEVKKIFQEQASKLGWTLSYYFQWLVKRDAELRKEKKL